MPRSCRFLQLDVFSGKPLLGNPLAVVVDGDSLDDAAMQAFARWTNLSETTFLLSPTNAAIMAFLADIGDPAGYGLRYRASQGREVGRDGCVEVVRDAMDGSISIGGACAIGIRGELQLD